AEDGIRGFHVTGVQTCALPISTCDKFIDHLPIERQCARWVQAGAHISPATLGRSVAAHIELLRPISDAIIEQTRGVQVTLLPTRSEERRVGKRVCLGVRPYNTQ